MAVEVWAMAEPAVARMTVEAFLRWVERQPGRFELVDGAVVAMAPERAAHARVKFEVAKRLDAEVRRRGLPCEVFPDGMLVRVDETTAFEPDALLRCGTPLPPEAVEVPDPLVVVEVLSPTSSTVDTTRKLEGYFRLPSVQHYLVVDPLRRAVVHHARTGEEIRTRILHTGTLTLDPPGLTLEIETLFPETPPARA